LDWREFAGRRKARIRAFKPRGAPTPSKSHARSRRGAVTIRAEDEDWKAGRLMDVLLETPGLQELASRLGAGIHPVKQDLARRMELVED
jgi:hypothetical protein